MVALIIHVTRMENFENMKRVGSMIMDTLSPRDRATVHFNTLYGPGFTPATTENLLNLKAFITRQPFSITADLDIVFRDVFQAFYSSRQQLVTANIPCHNIVLFLSDSPLYDNLTNEIRELQHVPRIDIFTYTFNKPFVDPTVPQAIACAFGGAWLGTGPLDSPIGDQVTSYLSFYSRESSRNEITWAGEIEDVLSQHKIFTGCLPVYQNESADLVDELIGVVCIDLDADRFKELDGGTEVRIALSV